MRPTSPASLLFASAALGLAILSQTPSAQAFCGFYVSESGQKLENEATQAVLMRIGTRTVLSMQNAYKGPVENFAMVVPVPVILQKENVKTLPRDVLDRIEQLDAPRLVEYWEQDPCAVGGRGEGIGLGNIGSIGHGAGTGMGFGSGGHVEVHARFSVGEYDIVILGADDSGALETWLHENHYAVPAGAAEVLRPYVQSGSKFFVAKVDPHKVTFDGGRAMLSPLRFHYDTDTFSLPVRLGLLNSAGTQDLVVHILAPGTRYEVANYANVMMPTNLDVAESTKGEFAPFYAALFDRVAAQNPRSVVTEYAWQASTCDPCPGPALDSNDIQTLGGDVAPTGFGALNLVLDTTAKGALSVEVVERFMRAYSRRSLLTCFSPVAPEATATLGWNIDSGGTVSGIPTVTSAVDDKTKGCLVKAIGAMTFAHSEQGATHVTSTLHVRHDATITPYSMVLTRLHMRYSKETLRDDLVFKVADPIVGGREFMAPVPDGDGGTRLEQGSRSASINNFQSRYVIRHPWTGKIECAQPVRGVWSGPPSGPFTPTQAATKTAFAPRGALQLASFLSPASMREVGLNQSSPVASATAPAPSASAASTASSSSKSGGCSGCALGDSGEGAPLAALAVGVTAFLGATRRRRRHRGNRGGCGRSDS